MEVCYYLTGISNVFYRLLSRLVISCLLYGIFQTGASAFASVIYTGIQDIFDFEFFDAVNFYKRGRWLYLTRNRVIRVRAEQINVEHRVVLYRCGQV